MANQLRADGYLVGFSAGARDAFQKGFTQGYNQAVIDLAKPRAPQPPPTAEQPQIHHQNQPDPMQGYATV